MTKEEAIELIECMSMAFVPTDQYGDYTDPEPYEEAVNMAIEALSTERTGEWIVYPLKDEGRVELECPECGYALIRAADRRPHFCENCGAKMGGDE